MKTDNARWRIAMHYLNITASHLHLITETVGLGAKVFTFGVWPLSKCFSSMAVQKLAVAKYLQHRIKAKVQDDHLIITSTLRGKDKNICTSRHLLRHKASSSACDTLSPCRSRPILLGDVLLVSAKTRAKCPWGAWHPLVQEHLFFFFLSYTTVSAGMGSLICKLKLCVGTKKWWVCWALNYFGINK